MTDYPELREALNKFREVFVKKMLPVSAITLGQEFLRSAATNEKWTPNDAFRIYNIIKPHSIYLKKLDFDFNQVPKVTTAAVVTNLAPTSQERMIGYDGTNFLVFFQYRQDLVTGIKMIPGARYFPDKKNWTVPISSTNLLKQFAMGNNFHMGEMAFALMNNVEENLENSYNSEYIELNLDVKKEFYPFQTGGIDYTMKNKRVIIADQMGLGKTIQAIGGIVGTEAYPFLVICPKGLRLNWQEEIHAWTKYKAIVLDKRSAKQLPLLIKSGMVQAVITNFDGVKTHFISEIKKVKIETGPNAGTEYDRVYSNGLEDLFKGVILDEGHYCRNKRTLRYKTVKKVFEDKDVRIILTGTPIVKGPEDLGALLELIGQVQHFGGYHKFITQYKKMDKDFQHIKQKPTNKSQDVELKNLNIKLRSLCFIRREKFQVMKDMPEKFRKIIRVEIDNQDEYDHCLLSLQDYLVTRNVDPGKIDQAMRAEVLVRMGKLKQISARGKLSAFSEFVQDVLEGGEKLVIFCWYNETAQFLKDNFRKFGAVTICGNIDGHVMKDEEIQANKNAFQTDPNTKLIICTYGKGSVGHTLTAAYKWAAIELGWTYADQAQAEDRIHRIGQVNACECYYFLGHQTIDEDIYRIIDSRRITEKLATGGTEEIPTETIGSIIKKLMNIKTE